jgi:ComF family protein
MRFIRQILDFILPTSCSFCNDRIGDSRFPFICSTCWSDFALLQGPLCPQCGRPFDSPEALSSSPEHVCLACRRSPPLFDQALSVGYFEGSLREAVHQFKYRPCRSLGKPLGDWMATNVRLVSNIDIIMPVPLHAKRLRQRGFNQALLLAHRLSEIHGIPCSCDNLYRSRPTRPQVELTGAERIRNVTGAFTLRKAGDILNRSVVLVDDVFTTGATMNECASVLKKAGAAQVSGLTLARALS